MNSPRLVWFGAFLLASLLHVGAVALLLQRSTRPPTAPKPVAITLAPIPASESVREQPIATFPAAVGTMAAEPAPRVPEPEPEPRPAKKPMDDPRPVVERAERSRRGATEALPPSPPAPATSGAPEARPSAKVAKTTSSVAPDTEISAAEPAPRVGETEVISQSTAVDWQRQHLAATWQRALLAHLARHKRYPPRARARGDTGIVEVRFRIDRRGVVQVTALHRTSGNPILDRAALDMLERATPVPPPPAAIPDPQLTLVVPVRFALR